MSPELFKKYSNDPKGTDEEVRRTLKISEDKYYSVSMMNDIGAVTIISNMHREVKAKKISKSNQP